MRVSSTPACTPPLMEWLLRIMANLLQPYELGPPKPSTRRSSARHVLPALGRSFRNLPGRLARRRDSPVDVLARMGKRHEGDLVGTGQVHHVRTWP